MTKSIVYISRACSPEMFRTLEIKQNVAAAKFNYSIMKELSKDYQVHSLYTYDKSFEKSEVIKDGYIFQYITNYTTHIKRVPYFLKQTYQLLKKKEAVLFADVLNYSDALIAGLVAKVLKRKSIAVVTDFPEYMGKFVPRAQRTIKQKAMLAFKYFIFNLYDNYVLLTDAMHEKLAIKDESEYIVIEGIGNVEQFKQIIPNKKKQVMYAGTLCKDYGIVNLVEAFEQYTREHDDGIKLVIYGQGDCAEKLQEISDINDRICYKGVADNSVILQEECDSMLLVNPRPVYDGQECNEYEKYSFPSKTMEYMSSGTPILTMRLSGMPEEYVPYIYEIKEATVNGIYKKLEEVLSLGQSALEIKGEEAKKFIHTQKNATIQVGKIVDKFL